MHWTQNMKDTLLGTRDTDKRCYSYWVYTLVAGNLEKATAAHSSTLAWKIPWTEEPGRLQPIGSLGVGHNWATSLSLFTFMHWRRKWQPTPVFLPGESQGPGSLAGCPLWGCTESDMTEATEHAAHTVTHRGEAMWRHRRMTAIDKSGREAWNSSFPNSPQKEPTLPKFWF